MLRELLAAFKKESKLDAAFELVHETLGATKEMFVGSKATFRNRDVDFAKAIASQDRHINKAERAVRKNVLKHLAVSGGEHAVSALVLTSIIIDIERIGDYTKNIIELAAKGPKKPDMGEATEDLNRIENAIEDIFDRLQLMLVEDREADARMLIQEYAWVNPLIDRYVDRLISGDIDDLPTRDAVTLALYLRYLKRIFSHLRNIVTSVFRPFHKIGYLPHNMKITKENDEENDEEYDEENDQEEEV